MPIPGRRRRPREAGSNDGPERVDALVIGLGNPGDRYRGTRHSVGFEVVDELARRWGLSRPKSRFRGRIAEGRARPGGPRVALLRPETYMNESGLSAGPARGAMKVGLERTVVIHDEIDLPFGEVRSRQGGGMAGHNGLKSLRRELGSPEFWRVRVGVGRPDSTDPERVSAWVLGRFTEPAAEVRSLVEAAADEADSLVERIASDS